ncbi:MAG: substrate-binding domain-containing protein [Spirochaetales bacterium]|nr:substrate-binding domain-containing protein [Spirochaetales bacterium]
MKNLYLFLLSLMATLVLFMTFSSFYKVHSSTVIKLNQPIELILKSTHGETMDFWQDVKLGVEEASKEFGVEVNMSGPRFEKDINEQITIFNQKIDLNPPLIILAASDFKRLSESVKRASDLDIPIITLDSGVDSELPKCFVGTDNFSAGVTAGNEILRLLNGETNPEIAIVAHLKETTSAIDRESGVRAVLNSDNIVGTWFCDVEEEKAYRITLELLKNENLRGIVALNEVATLGVAKALKEKLGSHNVKLVGFDNSVMELTYLEEGILSATVVQRPYNMGYIAVKTAVDYIKGHDIETSIDTGSVLINKSNMFKREYQELIFPFSN